MRGAAQRKEPDLQWFRRPFQHPTPADMQAPPAFNFSWKGMVTTMKKKLSAMCLVISLFITMFPVSAKAAVNQDGYIGPIETPESDAVKISTAEDLDNIRDDLSGSYVLVSDIDLSP